MSLSVVQSTGKAAGAGNCAFTLSGTPAAGNGLLAFVYYNDSFAISPPAGSKWLLLASTPTAGNGGTILGVFWHAVQAGDGTAWTFPVTGDFTSGQLYEVTGADNQFPVSGVVVGGSAAGAASIVSPSAAPAVASSLAFAAETDNNGTGISSVTAGWTLLADTGSFHGGGSAYMGTLTSAAASCTFTMAGTSAGYSDVTILIAPAAGSPATLYPVQDASRPSASGNITMAFNVAPAPGNLMLAFTGWNGGFVNTPPSGWTRVFSVNNASNDALAAWWRVVQAGDAASYTWTLSGDFGSGEMYEITGALASGPVNGFQAAADNTSVPSRASPAVTPSVLGCLPFAAETSDGSGDQNSQVTSGWAPLSAHLSYHGGTAAFSRLTTDTVTGITCTFTYTATAGPGADATVLIAPAPQASSFVPPLTSQRSGLY